MTIYFILAFFIWFYGIFGNVNKTIHSKKRYVFLSFTAMIMVASLRSYTVGSDLQAHYASSFKTIANLKWPDIPSFSTYMHYELGYSYYCKLVSLISTNIQVFIFITSLILIGIYGIFIYRNSKDVVLSTNIFLLYCIYYMYLTMLREALAISIVLIGYEFLKNEKLKSNRFVIFAAFVVLAATCHSAAIVCLSFIPFEIIKFSRKQIVPLVGITSIAFVLSDKIYSYVASIFNRENYIGYVTSSTESIGNFNRQGLWSFILVFFVFALGYYVLVWRRKRTTAGSKTLNVQLEQNDSFLLYTTLLCLICRLLLFRMNIMDRLSYYFLPFVLILYPRAIKEIKLRNNRFIVRCFIYGIFIAYFLFITFFKAEMFFGVVPYQFFWYEH